MEGSDANSAPASVTAAADDHAVSDSTSQATVPTVVNICVAEFDQMEPKMTIQPPAAGEFQSVLDGNGEPDPESELSPLSAEAEKEDIIKNVAEQEAAVPSLPTRQEQERVTVEDMEEGENNVNAASVLDEKAVLIQAEATESAINPIGNSYDPVQDVEKLPEERIAFDFIRKVLNPIWIIIFAVIFLFFMGFGIWGMIHAAKNYEVIAKLNDEFESVELGRLDNKVKWMKRQTEFEDIEDALGKEYSELDKLMLVYLEEILFLTLWVIAIAFLDSFLYFLFIRFYATKFVKFSIYFGLVVSFCGVLASIPTLVGLVYTVPLFIYKVGMLYFNRKKREFATQVFKAATYFVAKNPAVLLVSFFTLFFQMVVSFLVFKMYQGFSNWGLRFAMIFAFLVVMEVIGSITYYVTAEVCARWYFHDETLYKGPPTKELGIFEDVKPYGMPRFPTLVALKNAFSYSFGPIIVGSFLLATLKFFIYVAKKYESDSKFWKAVGICIMVCCHQILATFNTYAFVFVAIFGEGYYRSAKETYQYWKRHIMLVAVSKDMVESILATGSSLGGILSLVVGVFFMILTVGITFGDFEIFNYIFMYSTMALFYYIIGFAAMTVPMAVLDASVATFFICFEMDKNGEILSRTKPEIAKDVLRQWEIVRTEELEREKMISKAKHYLMCGCCRRGPIESDDEKADATKPLMGNSTLGIYSPAPVAAEQPYSSSTIPGPSPDLSPVTNSSNSSADSPAAAKSGAPTPFWKKFKLPSASKVSTANTPPPMPSHQAYVSSQQQTYQQVSPPQQPPIQQEYHQQYQPYQQPPPPRQPPSQLEYHQQQSLPPQSYQQQHQSSQPHYQQYPPPQHSPSPVQQGYHQQQQLQVQPGYQQQAYPYPPGYPPQTYMQQPPPPQPQPDTITVTCNKCKFQIGGIPKSMVKKSMKIQCPNCKKTQSLK